jgi:hypothetical protein
LSSSLPELTTFLILPDLIDLFLDFSGFDVSGFDFSGFDFSGFDFSGFDFSGFDFSGFDMLVFIVYGCDVCLIGNISLSLEPISIIYSIELSDSLVVFNNFDSLSSIQ